MRDRPVNAVGYINSKTLIQAIHAGLLALDYSIRKDNLIQTSDVLKVTLDISTFNQLGVVLHLTHIGERDGCIGAAAAQGPIESLLP